MTALQLLEMQTGNLACTSYVGGTKMHVECKDGCSTNRVRLTIDACGIVATVRLPQMNSNILVCIYNKLQST